MTYILMEVGDFRLESLLVTPTLDALITIVERQFEDDILDSAVRGIDEDVGFYRERWTELVSELERLRDRPGSYLTKLKTNAFPGWTVVATGDGGVFNRDSEWDG